MTLQGNLDYILPCTSCMHVYGHFQILIFVTGIIPLSEATQESTTTTDNGDVNEESLATPVEEQSEN